MEAKSKDDVCRAYHLILQEGNGLTVNTSFYLTGGKWADNACSRVDAMLCFASAAVFCSAFPSG